MHVTFTRFVLLNLTRDIAKLNISSVKYFIYLCSVMVVWLPKFYWYLNLKKFQKEDV